MRGSNRHAPAVSLDKCKSTCFRPSQENGKVCLWKSARSSSKLLEPAAVVRGWREREFRLAQFVGGFFEGALQRISLKNMKGSLWQKFMRLSHMHWRTFRKSPAKSR